MHISPGPVDRGGRQTLDVRNGISANEYTPDSEVKVARDTVFFFLGGGLIVQSLFLCVCLYKLLKTQISSQSQHARPLNKSPINVRKVTVVP